MEPVLTPALENIYFHISRGGIKTGSCKPVDVQILYKGTPEIRDNTSYKRDTWKNVRLWIEIPNVAPKVANIWKYIHT